jgi:ketosteroid isomerase-like protein
MSQANLTLVRDLVASLNAADVEAMVARFYSRDAEFTPAVQAAVEGTVYRGSDQIRAYYEEIYSVWDKLHVDLQELTETGDSVLATGTVTMRGKTSGAELRRPWAFVFELAGGRICRQRNFTDRAAARRAAGLED